jgi:signal transduction histidine kinase
VRKTVARAIAVGALVVAIAGVAASGLVTFAIQDRIDPGEIVVVGDPDAPGMREVIAELEDAVRRGDTLTQSEADPTVGVILVVVILLWIGVGVLIVWRQPGNWAGWLFLITGSALPMQILAQGLVVYDLRAGGDLPLTGLSAWVGENALYPVALIPLLLLLYPDGHPPSPRWRWAVVGLVGGTALGFLGFLLRPGPFNNWRGDGILYENPLGIDGFTFGGAVITVGTVIALVAALSTVVAVVQRFRRSRGEERQQMRILAFVAAAAGGLFALLILLMVVGTALGLDDRSDDSGDLIFGVVFGLTAFSILVGVPVAYLVAILRYRLWELDVVVKKTLVFAIVAGAITLLAVVILLALPVGVFGTGLSGWERGLLFVGVAIGWLIGPLRRRARRVADRIVYGKRATPYEILTAFSERVGHSYATEDVIPRMARLLVDGTGADRARVLVRVGSKLVEQGRWPDDDVQTEGEHREPVIDRGEELGALAVSMPANDPMNPAKEKLIRDLASQAGLVLRNVKLIEDLRASRQRLVAAQDEERRKIERNLHDGAQQQLVALTVQLRLARGLVERDPAKAADLLDTIQGSAGGALEELRDLARGIYPPLLADQGLPAALEAQARKAAVPTTVEGDGVGRYAREVEAAVYFCALEALNNVAKYAGATHATIRLTQRNGNLTFSVEDDGRGFDPAATGRGTGLQGMADRLEAIGGELEVETAPGGGTSVGGRVPTGGRRS